jgi:hypothetical protein
VSDVSRRDVVKWLAGAPAFGAIAIGGAQRDRAMEHLRTLAELGTEAPYAPKFFSPHEWRTVRLLVDYVIPRDERSGSATDAKVPEFMDFILADADTKDLTRTEMRGGLAWLDLACQQRSAATFADCADVQRRAVLDLIAWPKKALPEMSAGATFFNHFRDFTASGFWSTEMGWKDLRYLGNVPVAKWEGCPPAALEKLGVNDGMMDARPVK